MTKKEWTLVTLLAYVERRFTDLITRLDERHNAQQVAVDKASDAVDRRLEQMNEFRAQQADVISTFLPRAEFEAQHKAVLAAFEAHMEAATERQLAVSKRLDIAEGRGLGMTASWGYLVGAIAALGAIVSVIVLLTGR